MPIEGGSDKAQRNEAIMVEARCAMGTAGSGNPSHHPASAANGKGRLITAVSLRENSCATRAADPTALRFAMQPTFRAAVTRSAPLGPLISRRSFRGREHASPSGSDCRIASIQAASAWAPQRRSCRSRASVPRTSSPPDASVRQCTVSAVSPPDLAWPMVFVGSPRRRIAAGLSQFLIRAGRMGKRPSGESVLDKFREQLCRIVISHLG
jgi:hypothetical protein